MVAGRQDKRCLGSPWRSPPGAPRHPPPRRRGQLRAIHEAHIRAVVTESVIGYLGIEQGRLLAVRCLAASRAAGLAMPVFYLVSHSLGVALGGLQLAFQSGSALFLSLCAYPDSIQR